MWCSGYPGAQEGQGGAGRTVIHQAQVAGGGESGGPLYRYDKLFPGVVQHPGEGGDEVACLNYHARPKGRELEYDWARLEADAEAQGLVQAAKAPGSAALLVRFPELCFHWLARLRDDPLFLLDLDSRAWVEPELARLGRRFALEDFE